MSLLTRDFYARDPQVVAAELIGKHLVRRTTQGICSGIIVETEAYLAKDDSASHSFRGRNRKNATMFRQAGLLYVYPIHGRCCLNTVTESRGVASAVLIRAVQPVLGIDLMQTRRQSPMIDLARGPGRLCEAFDVDRQLDGWDLTRGHRIWIESASDDKPFEIQITRRIGVTSAQDLHLRYIAKHCAFVSGPRNHA
ncbi:MAG: DNA-3-methyladenine glycosylase [Planctomycetaceae bacterium]